MRRLKMKICQECNREYENSQTVGEFYGVCDECYKGEYKIKKNKDYMLPLLDLSNIDITTEMIKVTEEQAEFIGAVAKFEAEGGTDKDKEHIIEEFYDNIQASLGVLDKMGLIDLLEEGRIKHIAKLVDRGWKFKAML